MDAGRRRILAAIGASAASIAFPAIVRAHGTAGPAWGSMPSYTPGPGPVWNTPPDIRILEIHLYGGLSMWETFYCRPPTAPDRFRGFSLLPFGGCDSAFTDPAPAPFGNDAAGNPVHLSAITKPLWSPAILNKMRIVVLAHRFDPHEGAIPVTLTGFELGSPRLAGLGAVIQHHFAHHDIVAETPPSRPYSYVCWPERFHFSTDNLQASAATGMHPGFAKPLVMHIGPGTATLLGLLQRTGIRSERDAALDHFIAQYRDQLRHSSLSGGARARSKGFASFESSAAMLKAAPSLNTLLSASGSPLSGPFTPNPVCPAVPLPGSPDTSPDAMPGHAIKLAAYLLSQTGANAPRYVCVIDKGLHEHNMGGGYDTHGISHMQFTTVNLWNVLVTLRQLIDAGTIDLSRVMIVLSTEFGRTTGTNRDHWPQGFCNVLIGGPVTCGVSGAIRDTYFGAPAAEDGRADLAPAATASAANPFPVPRSFSPADIRAAILVAANIFPFEPEQFAVRDISFATAGSGHRSLMMALKTGVLGAAVTA